LLLKIQDLEEKLLET
jgi:hypothetical protein